VPRCSQCTDFVAVDEALRRELQQLGHRFQIPVRIVDVHMAEIRGEYRQQRVDGAAGTIALDERPDCETVPLMPRAA